MRLNFLPVASRPWVNVAVVAVLALSAIAWLAALLGSPNFYTMLELGPGYMVRRSIDYPVDGALFVLLPLGALAQAYLAMQMFRGQGAPWVRKVALGFVAIDLVVLGGFAVLAYILRNLNLH